MWSVLSVVHCCLTGCGSSPSFLHGVSVFSRCMRGFPPAWTPLYCQEAAAMGVCCARCDRWARHVEVLLSGMEKGRRLSRWVQLERLMEVRLYWCACPTCFMMGKIRELVHIPFSLLKARKCRIKAKWRWKTVHKTELLKGFQSAEGKENEYENKSYSFKSWKWKGFSNFGKVCASFPFRNCMSKSVFM